MSFARAEDLKHVGGCVTLETAYKTAYELTW
jgi:hypothetical protein